MKLNLKTLLNCCFSVSLALLHACGTSRLEATEQLETSPSLGGAASPMNDEGIPSPDASSPGKAASDTLTVSQGALRDPCGTPILLRGVSERVVVDVERAATFISEIAQTGANALRVVWLTDAAPESLSRVLEHVAEERLVAVVEFQDRNEPLLEPALQMMVEAWTRPEMVATLQRYQRNAILELGTGVPRQPTEQWSRLFTEALARLRAAGLRMPIAIRAPVMQGPEEEAISALADVVESDPLENSLVATFFWSGDETAFAEAQQAIQQAGMVPFIAEFSGYQSGACGASATAFGTLLDLSAQLEIGWFAWAWGGFPNAECNALDMTEDGTLAGLVDWGRAVALAHPNGISRTSVPIAWNETQCNL